MSSSKVGDLIPAPQYDPGTDIAGGPKQQVQRYVRAISAAATRFQNLMDQLFISTRDRTATEKLFLLGALHHAELFTDILSAFQEPWKDIQDSLLFIEKLGRALRILLVGGSEREFGKESCGPWRMKSKMVPNLTCYELAIRIIIERLEMLREDKAPKGQIGNFPFDPLRGYSICLTCLADNFISTEEVIEHLRPLYWDEQPEMHWYGAPRTVALCVTATGRIQVATSKDIWPPKSFMLSWVVRARKSRFAGKGVQASEALIREVNHTVRELALSRNITDKQAALNIAIAKEVAINLEGLHAQAFDSRNFRVRDRWWRCRITFGFSWLSSEKDPSRVSTKEVRDFEGVWEEKHSWKRKRPTRNLGCMQSICCGGNARDRKGDALVLQEM